LCVASSLAFTSHQRAGVLTTLAVAMIVAKRLDEPEPEPELAPLIEYVFLPDSIGLMLW
jgi:hypothetical protein